jgi:hypothetical protein
MDSRSRGNQDVPDPAGVPIVGAITERGLQAAGELPTTAWLCAQCLITTQTQGAAITVLSSPRDRELMFATDALAQYLDEIQFTSGNGPCVDAFVSGTPTYCDDTASIEAGQTWPGFAGEAERAGAGGVYAFPLRGGSDVFGVLELYRVEPSALSPEQIESAHTSVRAISPAVLGELSASQEPNAGSMPDAFHRPEVNQAVGMIAIQLRVPISEALAALRAAAYAEGKPVWEVAMAVVTRDLRFDNKGDLW